MGALLQPGSWGLCCLCLLSLPCPCCSIALSWPHSSLLLGNFPTPQEFSPRRPRSSGLCFPCFLSFPSQEEQSQNQDCRKRHKQNGVPGWGPGMVETSQVEGCSLLLSSTCAPAPAKPSPLPTAVTLTSLTSPLGSLCFTARHHTSPTGSLAGLVLTFLILYTCAHSSVGEEALNRVIQYSRTVVW